MKLMPIAVLVAVLLTGCSHTASYNSGYLSGLSPAPSDRMDGKVLIYTEQADDHYVFTGKPTSFTGGGTSLSEPLGQITRDVAAYVYARHFEGGVDTSNTLDNLVSYRAIVRPRLLSYEYEYNQLKNLGFAITPGVTLEIETQLLDQAGKTVFSKKYASGLSQGHTYMVSGKPGELINQLTHETIYKLMEQSAQDIKNALRNGKASSGPATD